MTASLIAIVIVLVVAGIATLAIVARRTAHDRDVVGVNSRGSEPARPYTEAFSSSTGVVEFAAAPAAPPLFDLDLGPEVAAAREIRWYTQFDPRAGALDDTARLRLIGDLGVVAKEWCVPLLSQAYEEEPRPGNRQAALIALAACQSRSAVPTYRLALASGTPEERAIAADALADLEPPPKNKARTAVERR